MKNLFQKTIFTLLTMSVFIFTSCDELSQLALNIPLPIEFSARGSNTTISETEQFCLSDYQEWRDNMENVESVKFLKASYWTLDGSTPNLKGNVSFTLLNEVGNTIFIVDLGNITAADYLSNPFELQLTEDQVAALDDYLSVLAFNDRCFTSILTVTNVTGDTNMSGERVLNGKVEIVLETDVAL